MLGICFGLTCFIVLTILAFSVFDSDIPDNPFVIVAIMFILVTFFYTIGVLMS